jgi:hypothetical protein
MMKAAVIAGVGEAAASYVHAAIDDPPPSPTSAYALAIAALVHDDRELAARAAATMREGSEAFQRTADAIVALAVRDDDAYRQALQAIVEDFEGRDEHLTGVPIADTALMLERLAKARGMAVHPTSEMLPPAV